MNILKLASSHAEPSIFHNTSISTNFYLTHTHIHTLFLSFFHLSPLHQNVVLALALALAHTPTKLQKSLKSSSFLLELKCQFTSPYSIMLFRLQALFLYVYFSFSTYFQFITIHHYIICHLFEFLKRAKCKTCTILTQ